MNKKHMLWGILCLSPILLRAQGNCNDPITLSSVVVSNALCGASTGTIIVTPAGPAAPYTFTWQPPVSSSNVATGLPASTYNIHIERANNPACKLDTLVVVNNSNGPQVQANVSPAQCLANNGAIALTPSNLTYQWSTGATGPSISGLASKNYYVTATNPGTGCYSIFKYFVPRDLNSLNVSTLIQADAKCGMSNGRAQVLVGGGSGQYTYTPGPGPQYNNLPAGNYSVTVTDNLTGCFGSTSFSIQDLPVSGSVSITPHDVRCHGQATGFVEFGVNAGANFALPYVFTLKDGNGASYSPGSLPAGSYFLQITDADGCPLPALQFSIGQPPPFSLSAAATPETCAMGGKIDLQISGGNGKPYYVDWADLPGADNPEDRANLLPGFYAATVYDSLFCTTSASNIFVAPQCNNTTQVNVIVSVGTSDVFCVPKPVGLAPGAVAFSSLSGNNSGSTPYGFWSLSADGCLTYSAGFNSGFALDKICVVSSAPAIGLKDTFCFVVSIAQGTLLKSSIFFTTQVNSSATSCGSIPPYIQYPKIFQVGRPGLNGASDSYGTYNIDNLSGCLSFFAAGTPGSNVDEIKVAAFDTVLHQGALFSYFPSILPKINCNPNLLPSGIQQFVSVNCNGIASGCLPIPLDDVANYTVIDNNSLYSLGFEGCGKDTVLRYNLANLPPGGGPYKLLDWKINGQAYTGNFFDTEGLVDLMNALDTPAFPWAEKGSGIIRGGDRSKNYGPLVVQSASGSVGSYPPSMVEIFTSTRMRFANGLHRVVFRNSATACADTVFVDALCIDCPPIHSYPPSAAGGLIRWETGKCSHDTIFCTNIPNAQLGQYQITDNGLPFFNFDLCGNFVGLRLDTGLHELHFKHLASVCEWSVKFRLECKTVLSQQTISVTVPVDFGATLCLDTTLVPGTVTSVNNICPVEGVSDISWSVAPNQWCVSFSAHTEAADTLCLLLCDNNGQCALFTVIAQGVIGFPDSLQAVPDYVFTTKNQTVDHFIIANDFVGGSLGNLGGLQWVEFLTTPKLGIFVYNPLDGSISYTPNTGACGEDSIVYRITDFWGQVSTATVKILISCDKILVFNGISPNGDGRNDLWHIVGIEQFPNNTVQVFNRWGNLVFEQKGYRNEQAWDGQWNGKDLPDGTYFYVIDLGNGQAERVSGWLQIVR